MTEKSGTLENRKNLLLNIKIGKEILTFRDIEIEKKFFTAIGFLKYVDIEKVSVSNKIFFGERNYKYFIQCLYNGDKANPLRIMLPKTSAFAKSYDGQTEWTYFFD